MVARLEAADEQVATTALGALRKVLPSYCDVSDEALKSSALRNSASARKTLLVRRLRATPSWPRPRWRPGSGPTRACSSRTC